MKRNMLILNALLLSAVATAAENSLPEMPQLKAWRVASDPRQEKVLKPVLKDDSITFGNKVLQLSPEGQIQCSMLGNGEKLFRGNVYFYAVENGKTKYEWKRDHFDRERSVFRREGRKYVWELWYKAPENRIGPFFAVHQTLEVLPDDRISISYRVPMPDKLNGIIFRPSCFAYSLPDSAWFGSTADFSGKTILLTREFTKLAYSGKADETEWVFGSREPAKNFSIQVKRPEGGTPACYFRPVLKDFVIHFTGIKLPSDREYKHILDLRKGVEWKAGDVRGGVDFMATEKLEMPDKTHKNLIANSSLERGLEGWHSLIHKLTTRTGHWDWVPFELDDKHAWHGRYSMKLNCWEHGGGTPQVGPVQIVAEPGTYTVSFYARGEGKNTRLIVRIPVFLGDMHNWKNINNNTAIWRFPLTDKWTRYQATFEVKRNEPLLYFAFYPTGSGSVWLDAVQVEKGKKATAYQPWPAEGRLLTSNPENFISSKDKINGRFRVITAKPEMSGQVRIQVKNFFEETLLDFKKDFRTGKDHTAEFALPLDTLPGLGVFVVKAEYKLKDGSSSYDFHRYSKIEFQTMPRRHKRMFGMDYENSSIRYSFLKELDLWRKLGVGAKHHVGSWRKDVWDLYEKYGIQTYNVTMLSYMRGKPGRPQIQHFFILGSADRSWNITDVNDKRILVRDFHLDAGGKITPEYLAKLKQAAKTVAMRFPFIKLWTLGGEINGKMPNDWWGKGFSDRDVSRSHALLLKAFAEGVREGNPEAKVYQDDPANMSPRGGIAETDRLLEECNKLGVRFDLIAIHPYRLSPENPDTDDDAAKFLKMLDRHGYGKTPVLWPEGMLWGPFDIPQWGLKPGNWGKPASWQRSMISYDMGWTEKKTAAWYMRAWLVALKYSDRVIGATSGQSGNNCHMDLLFTPYAAMLMPNTLCSILGDASFKKDIRFAPYIRTYIFEDEKQRPVAVVWCHKDEMQDGKMDAIMAEADFGSSLESVLDMMNSPRAFKPGRLRFPVTHFPLFFRGKPGTLKQMIQAFDGAEVVSGDAVVPLSVSASPADARTLGITFRNRVSREFVGEFNGRKVRIPAAGQTTVTEPLKTPLKTDAVTLVKNDGKLKSGQGRSYRCRFEFEAFLVKRVPDGVTVDTLDWNKLPAVPFTRKTRPNTGTSGFFRLGWNKEGMFLETVIRDRKFVHVVYPRPHDRWQNDSMQVYFDTLANARQRTFSGYDEDDYEYGVFPNSEGTAAQVYRYLTVERQLGLATQAPQDGTFAPDMATRFSVRDGKLIYRVFFPAKYLLPIRLEKGWVFGFGLYAANSDEPKKISGALTLDIEGKGCHNRPHTWPVALLVE